MNLSEANSTTVPDLFGLYVGLSALSAFNFLVGLPANCYVVWLIASRAGGAMASELFAFNLAISEILFCLSSIYIILSFFLDLSAEVVMMVIRGLSEFLFMSRPIFQSCICLERYLAVVHPVLFLRFKPLRYRVSCCVMDWLLVMLHCMTLFMDSLLETVYLTIAESLFFLVFMSYCGISVLCVLHQPGPGDGGREQGNDMKKKAFKIIVIHLAFTIVTHLPTVVITPFMLGVSWQVVVVVMLVSLSIDTVSGFVTPLLYLHRVGKLPFLKF
ncbi:G-protein coupled receptor 20-like [Centroberyx affinis]|uniref:G-protein coupled receptor 20-like n=1 Tax=Centroberyx affinis TaxID=166261 RepID=UPI003A5BF60D